MPRNLVGPLAQRRRVFFSGDVGLAVSDAERTRTPEQQAAAAGVTFEPSLYPPRGSRALILTDQGNSAGGAGSTLALPGLSAQMDRGFTGAFRQLVIFADSPVLATRVTWAVLVDGIPAAGLGAVTMLFRAASSLSASFDTLRVEVPPTKTVSVVITNVDGGVRVLGAQLVGWVYKAENTVQGGAR